jgi:hypothetical protein
LSSDTTAHPSPTPAPSRKTPFNCERLAGTVDALDQARELPIGRLRPHPWRGLVVSRARPSEEQRSDKHRARRQQSDDENAHRFRMPAQDDRPT